MEEKVERWKGGWRGSGRGGGGEVYTRDGLENQTEEEREVGEQNWERKEVGLGGGSMYDLYPWGMHLICISQKYKHV